MKRAYKIHTYYAIIAIKDNSVDYAEYFTRREANQVFNNLMEKGAYERIEMVRRLRSLQTKGVAPLETL